MCSGAHNDTLLNVFLYIQLCQIPFANLLKPFLFSACPIVNLAQGHVVMPPTAGLSPMLAYAEQQQIIVTLMKDVLGRVTNVQVIGIDWTAPHVRTTGVHFA